jgi:hypothetical protein
VEAEENKPIHSKRSTVRGLVLPQGREVAEELAVDWREEGGKLVQRTDCERRYMPAEKSATVRSTVLHCAIIFSISPSPREGQKETLPQHIPGTGLSITILISPALLGKYYFLLISLQGPTHSHLLLLSLLPTLLCRASFPLCCVLPVLYAGPCFIVFLLDCQFASGQDSPEHITCQHTGVGITSGDKWVKGWLGAVTE